MPEIRYRRSAGDEPESVTAFGTSFEQGKWVNVPEKFLDKARGNPSFEVKGENTFGDEEAGGEGDEGPEAEERRTRARIAQQGADETRKAKQAEARGASHRDERA
ncbi:hypothetical protein C0214_19655 [Methylobacterium sp. DM1]|nr:hypothetical protein C0214_19655 [Methylobacterium sp. DM1]